LFQKREGGTKTRLRPIIRTALTALVIGILTLAFNVPPVESSERTSAAIFTSGFESGDYSEWTENATDGGATLVVVSDVAHHGSYSSEATFTAPWQGAWSGIYDLSANPVYVRWYARFNALPGNGQAFTLIESIDSNDYSIWDLDIWRGEGGTIGIWFYRTRPSISDHYYPHNFEVNMWYCFEVKFYLHASFGEYRVYLNGLEVIALTGLNTSGSAWKGIKVGRGSGFLSNLTTWTDCVKVADAYIGPEVIPGDIDGDHDVDAYDLYLFARAFGSSVEDPTYEPKADLDGDSDVDANDLNRFSANYGKTIE